MCRTARQTYPDRMFTAFAGARDGTVADDSGSISRWTWSITPTVTTLVSHRTVVGVTRHPQVTLFKTECPRTRTSVPARRGVWAGTGSTTEVGDTHCSHTARSASSWVTLRFPRKSGHA